MNSIKVTGVIHFDPQDMTKKHQLQASWKRVAMVMFDCDLSDYYCWFIRRRYNIRLSTPLRGPHVTFINDAEGTTNGFWEETKDRWEGMEVDLELDLDARTNGEFWWLKVLPNETLDRVRAELSLGEPYFSYHMTIGYPVNCKSELASEKAIRAMEMNEEQSHYIHDLLKAGLIN